MDHLGNPLFLALYTGGVEPLIGKLVLEGIRFTLSQNDKRIEISVHVADESHLRKAFSNMGNVTFEYFYQYAVEQRVRAVISFKSF